MQNDKLVIKGHEFDSRFILGSGKYSMDLIESAIRDAGAQIITLATALHVYYLQRKYPHAEMSLSCPRLRPIINNDKIYPLDVSESKLCQILCAYRIFLPFAQIVVSSRESVTFRNGIAKIAATKVSAGVSTGIGDHESKYTGEESDTDEGDEQFEINDTRSFDQMYNDMSGQGLQPVLNDYLYV